MMTVSFDLFGTLVETPSSIKPVNAVAAELEHLGIDVPTNWEAAYTERHCTVPPGREHSLAAHVRAALDSRGVAADSEVVERAVCAAFETAVETCPGACDAVAAARAVGPVAVCSNCSVPGLVERTLARSVIDRSQFDTVVTSVDCGWRKPHPRMFEAVAEQTSTLPSDLLHVGDDHEADGGVTAVGGRAVFVNETPLDVLDERLSEGR